MANQYNSAASKFSEGYERLLAKDYREAVVAFGDAIALFPLFETAYRFRAEAHRNLGQEQESRADLEAVISISQNRQREAEKMLDGGSGKRPNTAGPSPVAEPSPASGNSTAWAGGPTRAPLGSAAQERSLNQSPIVLVTGVVSLVMLLAAVVLIVFSGE